MNAFFNEFHYDNTSTDTNEKIELAFTAGTDLTGWKVYLYNGGQTPTGAAHPGGRQRGRLQHDQPVGDGRRYQQRLRLQHDQPAAGWPSERRARRLRAGRQ